MNLKRPLAILSVLLILSFYGGALLSAFSHNPNSKNWLTAAIFSTVAFPVFLYAGRLVFRLLKSKPETKKDPSVCEPAPERSGEDA